MEFIPGLPDDIAVECLIRVPFQDHPSISSVCRSWKALLHLPHFYNHRKLSGFSRPVIVLAQNRDRPIYPRIPSFCLSLFEPQASKWTETPSMLGYRLPSCCRLASVGYNVVLMGGLNPDTLEFSSKVFIYNFVSGSWRRGSDMPGQPRCFFACASDNNRTVFVAGGYDDDVNGVESALSYDVENDKWIPLDDMADERFACEGFFQHGKFHVIDMEEIILGEKSAHVYDVEKCAWDEVEEKWACPPMSSFVMGRDMRIYFLSDSGKVFASTEGEGSFQVIADMPKYVSTSTYMIAWDGNLMAIRGLRGLGGEAYVLDLKTSIVGTKLEIPIEYSHRIYSHCYLEI